MPLDAPVTSADVNGYVVMTTGYAPAPYDGAVRRLTLAVAVFTTALVLAACGDGIDERYDAAAPQPVVTEAQTTTTTTVRLGQPAVASSRVTVKNTRATYSGARSSLHLADGSWLLTGYDNHTEAPPEPGAVWKTTDLATFTRVGKGISDQDNQQSLSGLAQLGDTVVAVGTNFARNDVNVSSIPDLASALFDADSWYSTDGGATFKEVSLAHDASAAGVTVIDGALWAYGYRIVAGTLQGAMWTSTDKGRSWTATEPLAAPGIGRPPQPMGPLSNVLTWGDSLVAIGLTSATDPDGASRPLDKQAMAYGVYAGDAVDVGIWLSADHGTTWRATNPDEITGVRGAQYVVAAAIVGDNLVLLGAAPDPTAVSGLPTGTDTLSSFLPSGASGFQSVLWTCDYQLTRCSPHVLFHDSVDVVAGDMVASGRLVVAAVTTFDFTSGTLGGHVVYADPVSGRSTSATVGGQIEQIETVAVDAKGVILFGRSPTTNRVQVARVPAP